MKQSTWIKQLTGFFVGLYASLPVLAAPGNISDIPLIVTQGAQPNIMLLMDSSGSMGAYVPESPYNENTVYTNCPASLQVSVNNSQKILIFVASDGRVGFFRYDFSNGNWDNYDWGTTAGTGHTGHPMGCFDSTAQISAALYGNATNTSGLFGLTGSTRWATNGSNRGNGTYTGNYLNWYFQDSSGTAANFGAGASEKPGVRTRNEIAAQAANAMVDGLSNVNVGVTRFNGDEGGTLLQPIKDIASVGSGGGSTTHKDDVKSAISGISPSGSTPLGETMEEIGRYFIEGAHTQQLTMHPNGSSATIAGDDLFSHELDYNGFTKPGASNGTTIEPLVMESDKFCQKNFIVGLTDGVPTNDDSVDSDLAGYASDSDGFALSDVALALYDMDLRPDIDDLDGNEYKNNITTYMIGFADELLNNDPLLGVTAANGGGQKYFAGNATDLAAAFNAISADIGAKTASVASVAFNSSTLSNDSAVFQARFDTTNWSGSLLALPLDLQGNLPADNDGDGFPDPAWNAGTVLDSLSSSQRNNRVIMTYDGTEGLPFTYSSVTAAPTALHASDLAFDTTANGVDHEVADRLNYIRGDQSNEGASGNGYRSRSSILGDIVNSTPVYVGKSEIRWPNEGNFGVAGNRHFVNFVEANLTDTEDGINDRTPVIYVGANDGMLHGFNATVGQTDSGKEVFAYIPRKLLSSAQREGLHYYTDDSYIHKFYVDLTPTVSDAFIKTSPSGTADWRTVLVGGLRAGGQGYFALDVTNPGDFANTATSAANTVLWEFTDADDSDLGYSFARPTIAMLENNKWAAIFGNGYNSANGEAKLFILYLEEGLDGNWTSGDYLELGTGVGTSSDKNGLSSPAVVDVDGNGKADRVYAGDLKGNMWVFDLTANNTSQWGVAYKDGNGGGANPEPLFVANYTDANGNTHIQPITSAPLVALNTANAPSGSAPNLLVMFGTGQYVTKTDLTNTEEQSFYAVWDNGDVGRSNTALTKSDLIPRVFSNVTVSGASTQRRTVTGNDVDWSTDHGWYVDLLIPPATAGDGERVVSEPLLRRSTLFFNTIVPDSRPCSGGGTGWLVSLDYATGKAPTDAVFDANNDGTIDSSDAGYAGQEVLDGLPAQSGILGNMQYTPTSDGQLASRQVNVGSANSEGRLGWQEIAPKN